jgi:hypothetical protein
VSEGGAAATGGHTDHEDNKEDNEDDVTTHPTTLPTPLDVEAQLRELPGSRTHT